MIHYLKLFVWIAVYLGVGFGIGQATQGGISEWYVNLNKPSFNPPNWIFPIMWSFLYVLIATAGWKLWDAQASKQLKTTFITYTLFNWSWSFIFFGAHLLITGFFWIMVINIINLFLIIKAWKSVKLSAILMIPPILWTSFAALLNLSVWLLNS